MANVPVSHGRVGGLNKLERHPCHPAVEMVVIKVNRGVWYRFIRPA